MVAAELDHLRQTMSRLTSDFEGKNAEIARVSELNEALQLQVGVLERNLQDMGLAAREFGEATEVDLRVQLAKAETELVALVEQKLVLEESLLLEQSRLLRATENETRGAALHEELQLQVGSLEQQVAELVVQRDALNLQLDGLGGELRAAVANREAINLSLIHI